MGSGVEIEGLVFDAGSQLRGSSTSRDDVANRTMSAELQEEDLSFDRSLRPKYLKDYLGQEKVKESLAIMIQAALERGEAVDHILFSGPPGLGKTTLAAVVDGSTTSEDISRTDAASGRTATAISAAATAHGELFHFFMFIVWAPFLFLAHAFAR